MEHQMTSYLSLLNFHSVIICDMTITQRLYINTVDSSVSCQADVTFYHIDTKSQAGVELERSPTERVKWIPVTDRNR